MSGYQAVILAAGMGIRLSSALRDLPKGLITAGNKTLVERSVENLQDFGIKDIIIVTGYKSELYEAFASERSGITLVKNDRFSDSGNMYSFFLTRHLLKGDILLLESDLIYEKRALKKMLTSEFEDAVLISGFTGAGDEVYVSATEGRVDGISKDRSGLNSVVGEWVGISKLSPALQNAMFQWAEKQFESSLKGEYESDCLARITKDYAIGYEKIEDLAWSEVDDENHLDRMMRLVLPQVLQNDETYFFNRAESRRSKVKGQKRC